MTSLRLEQQIQAASTQTPLQYRRDIDGLRAVAVMSVVIFHAFPSALTGGFIGVDIFFVISGFLISSILIQALREDKFSLSGFYARRAARIFPALIVVLVSCLSFGWLAMLADEYLSLAKHSIAGAAFVSNLLLWSETSYFDVAANTKPLLHLWSLGIEEQFYFVWPLLLLAFWRLRTNLPIAIGLLIAVSFGLNLYQASHNPTADFYSPQTRFWELLAGALLSCLALRAAPSAIWANVMSLAGTAMIGYGLLTITSAAAFPGMLALVPVAGAVLIIAAGPEGMVNRFVLSNRLMVGIGLISYPLYLWHWPLLVFPRIIQSATPSPEIRATAIVAALVLAWATYRFIESPIRTQRIDRNTAIKGLCGAMVVTTVTALGIQVGDGLPFREAAKPVARYAEDLGRYPYITYMSKNFYKCSDEALRNLSFKDLEFGYRCFQSKQTGSIDILLLGDSHAEHLLAGFADEFKSSNVASFSQKQLPALDSPVMREAIERVAADPAIKKVFISALWEQKIQPSTEDPAGQLERTFKLFTDNHKSVTLLDDVPTFLFDPEACKYGRRFSADGPTCTGPFDQQMKNKALYHKALAEAVEKSPNVKYVPVLQYFCNTNDCSMVSGGKLLFRDPNHLTIEGSRYLAKKLKQSGHL
ncbi:acyltransferase family protein [Pseudomonas sp. A-RE-26]|uniref:acyltransferase family protein n=1 Tax=Pseudomonas sp. A-RE-26 TaxID=2832402 RepID=UPI001CBEBE10|nr:acyltransferase family protein [Pseudomonas sp. A-RE-26]